MIHVFPSTPLPIQHLGDGDSLYADIPLLLEEYGEIPPPQNSEIFYDRGDRAKCDATRPVNRSWQNMSVGYVTRCPVSHELSSRDRFLMHHYTNRVVHVFTALDNPKSRWKTIHCPRAFQGAGELVIQGALLSISAFSLANGYRIQSRQDEAQKWVKAAVSYRQSALDCVLVGGPRLKYKACLAPMLSMVSINVSIYSVEFQIECLLR